MEIIFADLVHTGHVCNCVPYGIALVAAYAKEKCGSGISVALTRKVHEIDVMLSSAQPQMICFSSYIWNEELSLAVAKRVKERFPESVTVFGGPNYPLGSTAQAAYLKNHPEVDYFIFREGEAAFVELYRELQRFDGSASRQKRSKQPVPGCHYYHGGKLIAGAELPLLEINEAPSPYLTGLCDRFLAEGHAAVLQTARGCPFGCAFCQEGHGYFNQIRRYDSGRTKLELAYIAQRAVSPKLHLADSNFGMYPEDLCIAEEIAQLQKQYAWPAFVDCISGKSNKQLVMRAAAKIKGGQFSAAIQSSDAAVLRNIKRQNVSLSELIEIATAPDLYKTHSFSEIILALPGDTAQAHLKSACDLVDAGLHVVRSHQFIMLPGAELSSMESRKKFGLETRFRVTPNTANSYSLFGQSFSAPEIDEICVATESMSFDDYLFCRCFDLSVEIFHNNGLFYELQQLLKQQNRSISEYLLLVGERARNCPGLASLYDAFLVDTQELWESRTELEDYLRLPGIMERYGAGELGRNEQLAYKAIAFFEHMDEVIDIAYEVARGMLMETGSPDVELRQYIDELQQFDRLRKSAPLAVDSEYIHGFHYDFNALLDDGFTANPLKCRGDEMVELVFSHSASHRSFIHGMQDELNSGLHGYVKVLNSNPKVTDYFRGVLQRQDA